MSPFMLHGAARCRSASRRFVIWIFVFACVMAAESARANTTDATFTEATGVLSLPNLRVDNEFYSVDLSLVDVARLRFKVNPATARYRGISDGSYFNASFLSTTTKLTIARLRVGNQIFSAVLNLVDAPQLIFELDMSSVRNIGTGSTDTTSALNAFSYLQDASPGLPLRNNYFTVTFPANAQTGFPQTTVNVPLPYGQMTVTPLVNTNSLVTMSTRGSTVPLTSTPINCSFQVNQVADMTYRGTSSIRLSTVAGSSNASWGNYVSFTCNTPVVLASGATWYLSITTPPNGDFSTTTTVTPTGETSGTATMTLNGTGTITAVLSNTSNFLTSSQFQGGSNLDFSVNMAANMTVTPDGSVYADGVLVKSANSSGGGGGSTGSGSCVNEFRVINPFQSYYSGNPVSIPFTATGTGSISNMDGGRVILISSSQKIEEVPRFRLQLMIPSSKLTTGTVRILDDQNNLGFDSTGGAIARLIYSIGKSNGTEVNDSFWSNKDWGSQRARSGVDGGTITITSMSPMITGTFSNLQLSGDGYPSLNNFFATVVDGKFCVSP